MIAVARRQRLSHRVILVLVLSLATGPGVLHGISSAGQSAVEIHKVDRAEFDPEPGSPVFILVLGNDARPGQIVSRADAIHVIGVNTGHHRATILNIPRDTLAAIPGRGTTKINAAHAFGGPELTAQTVGALVGIQIPFVVTTGFVGLASMVDELGGVEVDVPIAMNDANSGAVLTAGRQHLTGSQALAFSRNRGIPGGDFSRTNNQGILILSALAKMREQARTPGGVIRSLAVLMRHTSIHGLGATDLYRLGRLGLSIDPANVVNVTMPGSAGSSGGASVVFPSASAQALFEDFREDAMIG